MEALTTLLTEYSFPAIIIIIFLLLVAFKFVSDLIEWLYNKAKGFFKKQTDEEKKEEKLEGYFKDTNDHFEKINKRFDDTDEQILEIRKFQENTAERLKFIEERQQENTRSFLIDAHHKFCYEYKAIDDINLQSVERRYSYYKHAGGDTFIDSLIEDIRELPKVNLDHHLISAEEEEGIEDVGIS